MKSLLHYNYPPGLFPRHINQVALGSLANKSTVNPSRFRIPVLNIVFTNASDDSQTLEDRAKAEMKQIREYLHEVDKFYLENSYGTFSFDFKVKTVFLNRPHTWKGNISAEPKYSAAGNLVNPEEFPLEDEYTGYFGFAFKQTKDNNSLFFRNYYPIAGRNVVLGALTKLEKEVTVNSWDDQINYSEWLDFGIPYGKTKSSILYTSSKMPSSAVSQFGVIYGEGKTGKNWSSDLQKRPISVSGRIFSDYTHCQLNKEIGWSVFAHELGHLLHTFDLYNVGTTGEGYLGPVSMMGNDDRESHFDAYLKLRQGWIKPIMITPQTEEKLVRLLPIYESPSNALLIYPDSIGHPDEFFLVEVRQKEALRWDGEKTSYDRQLTPDLEGVFIYHVNLEIPAPKERPRVDLEGDGKVSGSKLKVFNTSDGRNEFGEENSRFYDGSSSGLILKVLSSLDSGYQLEISWQRTRGTAEINVLTGDSKLKRLKSFQGWRESWDEIIPIEIDGQNFFGGQALSDLMFYDKLTGELEFYSTDSKGNISLIGNKTSGWRKTWDLVIPGRFFGDYRTDLLCYDKSAGEAEFWTVNKAAKVSQVGQTLKGWRNTWEHIVPGNFTNSTPFNGTEFLRYDKLNGVAEINAVDGNGGFFRIGDRHSGLSKTVDLIVPIGRLPDGYALLFYEKTKGVGEVWKGDSKGNLSRIGVPHTGWRSTWKSIVSFLHKDGQGNVSKALLFFDASEGEVEIYKVDDLGNFTQSGRTMYTRRGWDIILNGNYSDRAIMNFLFYEAKS